GAGHPVVVFWTDSVTLAVERQTAHGLHLAQMDVRTNAVRNEMDLPDYVIANLGALSDGWVWIPAAGDRIIARRAGATREYPKPPWYAFLYELGVDPSGHRVFFDGPDKSTSDSLGAGVLSLDDGSTTQWGSMFAEFGHVIPLADGGLFVMASRTQGSLSLFKLSGPGQLQSLGDSPRPMRAVLVSGDLRRATANERDYRADAWMSKVITH
ncbi:MAG: hypothetical protein JJD97_16150, partial [Gemmatimonadaceae bacterium]|nr:hypothetical protein [Gemmatimonadaceae bacterium]